MRVITRAGYELTLDEDTEVEVGQKIEVPKFVPEDVSKVPEKNLVFLAQYYSGSKIKWNNVVLSRYGIVSDDHFPEYMFHLSDEQLWTFLKFLFTKSGSMSKHVSGTGADPTPEVIIAVPNEGIAADIRTLLRQVGIKSRMWQHPQRKKWVVITSGAQSYLTMRPMLKKIATPKISKRIRDLDSVVPVTIHYTEESRMFDRVVEIHDV